MMTETASENVVVTALNLLDGMEHHTNWEVLQSAWQAAGYGFIEFCQWINRIAVRAVEAVDKREEQDFPGVWDYEVSCHVGGRVTKHVASTGALPTEDEVVRWFDISSDAFFEQGKSRK